MVGHKMCLWSYVLLEINYSDICSNRDK